MLGWEATSKFLCQTTASFGLVSGWTARIQARIPKESQKRWNRLWRFLLWGRWTSTRRWFGFCARQLWGSSWAWWPFGSSAEQDAPCSSQEPCSVGSEATWIFCWLLAPSSSRTSRFPQGGRRSKKLGRRWLRCWRVSRRRWMGRSACGRSWYSLWKEASVGGILGSFPIHWSNS